MSIYEEKPKVIEQEEKKGNGSLYEALHNQLATLVDYNDSIIFLNDEINDTIRMGLPVYGVSRQQQYPYEEYFWKNKNKI